MTESVTNVALSVLAYVPEVDSEGAQLSVKVCALHAYTLGELPDLPIAKKKLLLKVGTLELLASLAQREREQILLDQGLALRCLDSQLALDFFQPDLFLTALDQQAMHERLQLAHVVGPGVIAEAVL